MTYTALNATSVVLNLAKSINPFDRNSWKRLGPIFPGLNYSSSAAIILRNSGNNYMFWGDDKIRITQSSDISMWNITGEVFLEPRAGYFDSLFV
jgi:hypothetical protein